MKLPLYELKINEEEDDTGVDFIALVDDPAIERNFQMFSREDGKSIYTFKTTNEEKRIVSGPLMVANLPIYRRDEERGEHNVVFKPKTIMQIVQKHFRNKFTGNVNLDHDHNRQVIDKVFMFESFIIDSSRGIQTPVGFSRLTEGSWFGSFKVEDGDIWENFIKTGEFRGFSIEGYFNHEYIEDKSDEMINRIIDVIQQINKP